MRRLLGRAFVLASIIALPLSGSAWAQHGPLTDHLIGTGAWGNIEHISTLELTQTPDLIADVAVDPRKKWAYLANWGEPDCAVNSEAGGQSSPDAGAYVVDISDLENPRRIAFIPHHQDSRPGEGMQVIRLTTKYFNGYVLVMNNEQCGKNGKGGVSLWDVTRPARPKKLSEHFGDRSFPGDTNDIHSSFAWDAGAKAYVVMTDNFDIGPDTDILDITNPKRPRLVGEYSFNEFDIWQPEIGLDESFLHDMVVKKIGGRFILLLSYWDGGFVQVDVTDLPAVEFLGDTDYTNPDPELLESLGVALTPTGNAHEAEFTLDNQYFIGTDEEFNPTRIAFEITTGEMAGEVFLAGEFAWTVPISTLPDQEINGPTVYGGYGCPLGPPVPPASVLDPVTAPGEDQVLVLQRGPVSDPEANFEACFFSEKVEVAQEAGYDAVIIANHHVGTGGSHIGGHSILCGSLGHEFTPTIPGICIGHEPFHMLFDSEPAFEVPYVPGTEPAVGTIGEKISAKSQFDGWGYVHLFDRETSAELDTYAIDEAHDPAYAVGFGDLTVHEVATDPDDADRAYLSYYSGGLRSLQIVDEELVEVGGYLDPAGNDFWGVEAFVGLDGETYILGSDRDSGLWIFRQTGD